VIKVQVTFLKLMATILANEIIPEKDVLPGKLHLFPGYPVVEGQNDYAGSTKGMAYRPD
tara:strand:- start:561 stop:737 length:177 start_codon:yes stop_codon:yes gene_type:complete